MDAVKLKFQIFETRLKTLWQERNLNLSQVAEEEAGICNQFKLLFESIEENQLDLLNKHKLLCLRQKIEETWRKTYASDEVKMDFTDFTLDNDTEALLSKHQTYLDALQKYYSTNETLFKELELLIQLQNKFEASQLLLLDSTRLFRNRGGALLKEEKARQLTKKRLIQQEKIVKELFEKYDTTHDEPLLINGRKLKDFLDMKTQKSNMKVATAKVACAEKLEVIKKRADDRPTSATKAVIYKERTPKLDSNIKKLKSKSSVCVTNQKDAPGPSSLTDDPSPTTNPVPGFGIKKTHENVGSGNTLESGSPQLNPDTRNITFRKRRSFRLD